MCFRPCASGILNSNGNQILPTLVLLPPSSSPSPGLGLPHQVRVNIVSKARAPSKTLGKVDVVCREWQFCLGAVSNLVGVEFGRCDRASLCLTIVWRSPVRSYHWAGPIRGLLALILMIGRSQLAIGTISDCDRKYVVVKYMQLVAIGLYDRKTAISDRDRALRSGKIGGATKYKC